MTAVFAGGMQSPLTGTLIFSVVALLLGLVSIGNPVSLRRTVVMALPMLLLAVLVALGEGHEALILAAVLAAAGEALLVQERASAFVAGLGLFLAVRVIYAVLFILAADAALFAAGPWRILAAAIAVVVVAAALGRIWKHTGPLKWSAALYMLLLAIMCVAAAAIRPPVVFAGAAVLAISDIALAAERFLVPTDKDAPLAARRLTWLGRYVGQALIIFAAVGLA
jgi:uncharacterized membrane protein YhhN